MSTETLTKNNNQDSTEMPPVIKRAVELRRSYIDAGRARRDRTDIVDHVRGPQNGPEIMAYPALEVIDGIANSRLERKEKRARRAVSKHYRANQDVYQSQAVKYAAAEGVETSFGTDLKD